MLKKYIAVCAGLDCMIGCLMWWPLVLCKEKRHLRAVAGLCDGFVNIKYDISIKNDPRMFSESQKPQTRMSFCLLQLSWSYCQRPISKWLQDVTRFYRLQLVIIEIWYSLYQKPFSVWKWTYTYLFPYALVNCWFLEHEYYELSMVVTANKFFYLCIAFYASENTLSLSNLILTKSLWNRAVTTTCYYSTELENGRKRV